ncbi:MAG: alcohol dehydrogenase catalytic domain-containing protein, partial [Methyloprofundus sp.]|nr:alcohol dehydrogenase catalytic domain-containing protein [Methyloprofundus sp.]
MQAIVMVKAGGPDVLEVQSLPEPEINDPNQVKIRIKAAGINPIDTKVRKMAMFFPDRLPAVLGCDMAGEIVAVGANVTQFTVGDKVWACHGGLGAEQGNYAEYTVINARWVVHMPKTGSYITAAAAPLVLITAWGALFERGALQVGETVLIHAGAGGVGHVAIQLAKIKGARGITTVSDQQKAGWAKSGGADEVIMYTQEDVAE